MSEMFDQEDSSPSQRLRNMEKYVAHMSADELAAERAHFAHQAVWDALWVESIDRRITTEGSVA